MKHVVIIVLVLGLGFGAGYGATSLFVGPGTSAPADAPTVAEPEPTTLKPLIAAPEAPEEAVEAGVAEADDAAPSPTEAAADNAAKPSAEAPPKATGPAWEGCVNNVCRVDFGQLEGGISIRDALFEHGASVQWDRDFGNREKIGTLPVQPNLELTVHAIGLDGDDPIAARITFQGITGVIALKIGDKRIRLNPIH